jgi:hypothetical protein
MVETTAGDVGLQSHVGQSSRSSKTQDTGEWIPVKERLPEEGQMVIFTGPTNRQPSGVSCGVFSCIGDDESVFRCGNWVTELQCVTHWMPLPPPPAPQLTVKEALKLAVACVEEIESSDRYGDWWRSAKSDGRLYYYGVPLLPRLRAALEGEE